MAGDVSFDFDSVNGCYDEPTSCNKCGGPNETLTRGSVYDPNHSGETATRCGLCGHEDYWAHGHFMSGADGLDACDKYFNVTGYGLMSVERKVYEQYLKHLSQKSHSRAIAGNRSSSIEEAERPMCLMP